MKNTFKATILTTLITIFCINFSLGQDWELVFTAPPGDGSLKNICFVEHNNWQTGWAVWTDFIGRIDKTVDGGETWEQIIIPNVTELMNGADFVNENVGYITTGVGQIIKTIDGGYTWEEVYYDPDAWFHIIDFKDELNGVVGGEPHMMYTNDGGATWNNCTSPYLYSFVVYAGDDTYYGREMWESKVGKSTDGGQTWTNILDAETTVPLTHAIDFINVEKGIIGGANQSIGITDDGGQSWNYATLGAGDGDALDASFVDSDTVYVSGSRVYRSTDGGNTWFLDLEQEGTTYWGIEATPTGVVYVTASQYNGGWQNKIYRRSNNVEFLSADFDASEREVCEGSSVDFEDMSSGNITSWEWTFEGGTPATSTEQNPTVLYETPGSYDVELTISDGIIEVSSLKEDFINVLILPEQADMPIGDTEVCSDEISVYSSSGAAYATSYEWNFSPGNAGAMVEDGLQATITWNPEFSGNAFVSLSGFNACGEGEVSEVLIVEVNGIPMPEILGADLVCDEQVEEYSVDFNAGNSYVWDVNGGTITEGQGTNMITVTWGIPGNGNIMVTETESSGCTGDAEVFEVLIDDCTGLYENNDSDGITLYPNPVSNRLNIRFDDAQGTDIQIKVFDAMGKMIIDDIVNNEITGSVLSIDMGSYSKGLYFMQIQTHGTSLSKQFIKQ